MAADSAYTSIKQVPAGFKKFVTGPVNLDFGGGKYDDSTDYLKEHGIINLVLDPFNRSKKHNQNTMTRAKSLGVNSITCFNVLNVIRNKRERLQVLKELASLAKQHDNPVVIIQIYEGDGSGKVSTTTAQNNKKTAEYLPEVQKVFEGWDIRKVGNFIIV